MNKQTPFKGSENGSKGKEHIKKQLFQKIYENLVKKGLECVVFKLTLLSPSLLQARQRLHSGGLQPITWGSLSPKFPIWEPSTCVRSNIQHFSSHRQLPSAEAESLASETRGEDSSSTPPPQLMEWRLYLRCGALKILEPGSPLPCT